MNLLDHKTKITGSLLTLISLFEANSDTIQSYLSPKGFAYFTTGVGALVTVLGFFNSNKAGATK